MSSTTSGDSQVSMSADNSLPLDWTKVQRKRVTVYEQCCDDPSKCGARHPSGPRFDPENASDSNIIKGNVMFCLHEVDSSWVQGYFLPSGCRQPWGILAVEEEIDACLACADGGFRRISLTVYRPSWKPIKLESVDWTGGDMIQLRHEKLNMEANRILTGKACLPYMDRYFRGMVKELRRRYDVAKDSPVLEWLPDNAVVLGTMTLALPSAAVDASNDDSSGGMTEAD